MEATQDVSVGLSSAILKNMVGILSLLGDDASVTAYGGDKVVVSSHGVDVTLTGESFDLIGRLNNADPVKFARILEGMKIILEGFEGFPQVIEGVDVKLSRMQRILGALRGLSN